MDEQRLERALRQGPPFATRYVPSSLALDARPVVRSRASVGRLVLVMRRDDAVAGRPAGGTGGGGRPSETSTVPSRMGGWPSRAPALAQLARMGGSSATSTSFGRVRPRIGSSGRTPIPWTRSVPPSRPTGGDSPTARPRGPPIPPITTPHSSSPTSTQPATRRSRCGSTSAGRSRRRAPCGRRTVAGSPSLSDDVSGQRSIGSGK